MINGTRNGALYSIHHSLTQILNSFVGISAREELLPVNFFRSPAPKGLSSSGFLARGPEEAVFYDRKIRMWLGLAIVTRAEKILFHYRLTRVARGKGIDKKNKKKVNVNPFRSLSRILCSMETEGRAVFIFIFNFLRMRFHRSFFLLPSNTKSIFIRLAANKRERGNWGDSRFWSSSLSLSG